MPANPSNHGKHINVTDHLSNQEVPMYASCANCDAFLTPQEFRAGRFCCDCTRNQARAEHASHIIATKASILVPAIIAVTLLTLTKLIDDHIFWVYIGVGVIYGRVMYKRDEMPYVIGDAAFSITWGLTVVLAAFVCWFDPYKESTMRDLLHMQ